MNNETAKKVYKDKTIYTIGCKQYVNTGEMTHYSEKNPVIISSFGKFCVIGIVLCCIGMILVKLLL